MPMAPEPTAVSQFVVLLCLPTAPSAANEGSRDFGTSPLYGQLPDKPLLAFVNLVRVPDLKHNSG
jgi:hypothetical protein